MFDFLNRGFLFDEAGGGDGGGGTAVMDAPADPGSSVESVPVEGEHTDTSTAEETETPDETRTTETTRPESIISEDGKRLSEKARARLDQIAKEDPNFVKQVRNAIFEADRFRRFVPGGLREVQELRETVESLGGDDGIKSTRAELAGWQQFDQQFTAGDPRAIDFMVDTPEGKDSFLRLAPVAFGKFAELNPEGYGAYLAKAFVNTMESSRIPVALELLSHFIGDNPNAQKHFKQIADFVNWLGEMATKPVNAPKAAPTNPGEDPKFKELETRESNLTQSEWRRETAVEQNKVYAAELGRSLNGRKVTDTQREDILFRVKTKLSLRWKEEGEPKAKQYFATRDKDGFLKFCNAFSRKEIPQLIQEAVDRYVPNKPGPKATPNGATPAPRAAAPKPPQGFTFVQKQPAAGEIDWASPYTAIKQGKAMLKSGQRVTWKR